MTKINVLKLNNTFVIKKEKSDDFFISSSNSIIIPTVNFYALLKFMLFRGLIHIKALEGIIEEYKDATS